MTATYAILLTAATPSLATPSHPKSLTPLRMVALDMDGTLLNARHELSDESLATLRSLSARGIVIALCSGRSTAAIHDHAERLALSRPLPIVAFNGAAGLLAEGPGYALGARELFCTPLPAEAVDAVLAVAEGRGEVVQYYHGLDIHVACKTEAHVALTKKYAALTGVAAHVYSTSYEEAKAKGTPYKCLVMTDDADETLAALQESVPPTMATLIRGSPPFFVECLHPDVNKGNGLARLCDEMGIPLEAVVAFGDGDNDIEFISLAGLGVAMCNGRPPLLAVADRVTDKSNEQDGVAHCLHQLEAEGRLMLPAPRCVRGLPQMRIRRVNPSAVVGVRERVMWPGQPEMCILDEDSSPNALHLAAMDESGYGGAGSIDGDKGGGGGGLPSSTVCGVLSLFLPETHSGSGSGSGGGVAKFRKLAVDIPWQKRGLATALIETAAAEARLVGAATLCCDARASQEAFYRARGFERAGEPFDKYPGKGGEMYVSMRMAL